MNDDRLLTAEEVADLLTVSVSWVRSATRENAIPSIPLGRWRRYRKSAVLAWVEQLEEDENLTIEEAMLAASALAALGGRGYEEAFSTLSALAARATRGPM